MQHLLGPRFQPRCQIDVWAEVRRVDLPARSAVRRLSQAFTCNASRATSAPHWSRLTTQGTTTSLSRPPADTTTVLHQDGSSDTDDSMTAHSGQQRKRIPDGTLHRPAVVQSEAKAQPKIRHPAGCKSEGQRCARRLRAARQRGPPDCADRVWHATGIGEHAMATCDGAGGGHRRRQQSLTAARCAAGG